MSVATELAPTEITPDRLIAALAEVPGVHGVELEERSGGAGLRLRLAAGTDEAGVAAAAGLLLRERFGLGIDAGAVAIVEEARGITARATRLSVVRAGSRSAATVVLTHDGRTESADATAGSTQAGVLRAVAQATLAAAMALDPVGTGDLDGTVTVELADSDLGRRVDTSLPGTIGAPRNGSSPVYGDPSQAVVRAVLAAVGA